MLDAAFAAIARGDAVAALAAAQSSLEATPELADAHLALGLALQLGGDLSAAATALERAIVLDPNRAALHLARASLATAQRDPAAADAATSAAISVDPNSLGAYLMALHLALGRRQPDEAKRLLALAKRVAADDPQVLAAEGSLALAINDHADALRLLSQAAIALPDDPLVLAGLGLAHRAAGNHAFAEATLNRAIAKQPQAVGLRWALIDSLRRQGREVDAISPLRELLAIKPDQRAALALLGDLLMRKGEVAAGLDVYRQLILLPPFQLAPLDRLLQRMVQAGMQQPALAMLDEALARFPNEAMLWQRRMQGAGRDPLALAAVLQRWQQAQPDSANMLAASADLAEWRGDLTSARAHASEALARDPSMIGTEAILLRAELQAEPAAALNRIERLLATSPAAAWLRALNFWRGQAHDRLGQTTQAVAAWEDAWAHSGDGEPLPAAIAAPALTPSAGAELRRELGPPPRLLWSPPGGRPREVLAMLAQVPGFTVLDDRFSRAARADGFGPPRSDGGLASEAGWRHVIEQLGGDPSRCIDWLPHWDSRIAAALPGASLVAVVADPRDLLLNWLAFASPFAVRFPGLIAAATWLRQSLQPLLARIESADPNLLLVTDSQLIDDPAQVAIRLQQTLSLDALPDVATLTASRRGMGGLPVAFAPGHWRTYAEPLAAAFAPLQPIAERLGYRTLE